MPELNDGVDNGAVERATPTEQEDAVSSDDDGKSDESAGASSDEEAHAAAILDGEESAPEGMFQPQDNFDTLMEVFRFIDGCNNGAGLSNESTVGLLNLLRNERLELAAVIELLGNPENAEGFVLEPRQVNTTAGRVYTTPETATFWEYAHTTAQAENGPGAVVVPLILSSDSTILTGNERTRVWAVYISIANIPLRRRWLGCGKILLAMLPFAQNNMSPAQKVELFQAAMKIVLADLIFASHTGLAAKDPTGVDRYFVPLLFSYVADYPETCKVSCIQQLASAMPCSICYVGRGQLRDMERDPADHRTVQQQEQLVGDPTEAKEYSTIPIPLAPFALEGEGEIVNRLALVTVLEWHESAGELQVTLTMIQTVESVFPREGDGWNLIKVHLLTHVPESVRRAGLPSQYSAAVYENTHIRTCKLPYRTSNRRQPLQTIAAHNVRAAALTQLTTAFPARRRNQTALTRLMGIFTPLDRCILLQAIAPGTPQLTASRKSLTARPDHDLDAGSVFEEINKAVGGLLICYDTVMRHAGLRPFPAKAHTAVALPAQPTDHGHIKPHYVRAAASLHGRTTFSYVEYESARGQTQYGRLLMLLDAERPLDDSNYEPAEVAVLQRLTPQGLDQCTGCQMLGPPEYHRGLAVVPISQLRRTVHFVPSFDEPDFWYLNKWAYLINEERD
ncbi:unnamed protein product [Closterium sp. Yama58-4]|nr:unnamed protein product [Closterium sp. Yama58-4]